MDFKTKTNLPMKRRTFVDFIRTEVSLGEKDGQVVVKMIAKLQLHKLPWNGIYEIYKNRFKYITKSGAFTVVGTATCGDEPFDFEKGKRIAETRAQIKAYKIAKKIYEMLIDEFEHASKIAKWLSMNCAGCETDGEHHIIDLDSEIE